MQPDSFRFGGGVSTTILHPLVAAAMLVAVVFILVLPRKKAIVPFLLAFFTIPLGQVLVLGGLHFTMLQTLILTVLVRMTVFRGSAEEHRFSGGFNSLDKLVVLWSLVALLMFCIQFPEMQAVVKGAGDLLDILGGYLAVRFLICDREAMYRAIKTLAAVCVVQGVCMVSEQFTRQNIFSLFGANSPTLREGHIRSEGALGTLYGGVFAGVLIPLFAWLWLEGKSRVAAISGFAGATAMVFASHASTSWMALGGGLVGLAFWPVRKQMRLVRWGLVVMLVGLHLVMHGPVWSLIEKVDLTGGSSSYHRYMLVDNCIRHFGDWWLVGYTNYGSWGFDMWDLCNQYVAVALTGGLLALILFIMIYSRAFGAVGRARKREEGDRTQEWLFWCLGSSLFANVVASFGINYMVQLMMCLSMLLACISVATSAATEPMRVTLEIPVQNSFDLAWMDAAPDLQLK